jgi:urease accessory protein
MERDTKRMRGSRPFMFTDLGAGQGIDEVVRFIEQAAGCRKFNL